MKTIYKLSILILSVVFTACQNDLDDLNSPDKNENIDSNEIAISDGMITSPQWLVDALESTKRLVNPNLNTEDYWYFPVYSVKYDGQEYICIVDWFDSCADCGTWYYTLSGEMVDKSSELFESFFFNDPEERTLLWHPGIYNDKTRVVTKAWYLNSSVYTPNGSMVPYVYTRTEELTQQKKLEYISDVESAYPQVEILANPTTTYNCHGYAWHMTEGGSPVWINADPRNTYMSDGSYIVTSSAPTKVSYLSDDHSAITTSVPDVFISKWGELPLIRHHKNHSPYNTSNLSYLKLNDMPPVFIGLNYQDYRSGGSTVYASGGNAGITLSAFATQSNPTSYVWSADFSGECDRWYSWPSGSTVDVSVYLNPGDSGGMVRLECEMYNGSTFLGLATYYLSVYP